MKNTALLLTISIILLSSCSSVKFYNASTQEEEDGVQFYYPKPYLLVTYSTKDGGKDLTLSTQIIYLPDLVNPKYAKLKSGFGASNLSIGLSNGILTAVGQQSDSKIPETISSIAGLATAISGLQNSRDKLDPVNLYAIEAAGNEVILKRVYFQ